MLFAIAPETGSPKEDQADKCFLIVDDNAEMRAYIRRCLRTYGGKENCFLEAADGLEALSHLACHAVRVVITDVVMPRMDGLALCREIERRHPGTPVLVVTGEVPAEAQRLAQSINAGSALAKPFNARRLRASLDRLLKTA
ncbi:response regulator [Rhodocaloribacter sp.]